MSIVIYPNNIDSNEILKYKYNLNNKYFYYFISLFV